MTTEHPLIGSSFDDFLSEDGLLEESTALAVKRVIAWQLAQAMKMRGITKQAMAKRMGTSRSHINRILDATDVGLTLDTLSRAAQAVGCTVKVELN